MEFPVSFCVAIYHEVHDTRRFHYPCHHFVGEEEGRIKGFIWVHRCKREEWGATITCACAVYGPYSVLDSLNINLRSIVAYYKEA